MRSPTGAAALTLVALLTTGCEDELDFGFGDWAAAEDTVTLYSLDRPEYQGLPGGYNIAPPGQAVVIEDRGATGLWDFALTGGTGGEPLRLSPVGALLGLSSQAGIAPIGDVSYEELETAPRDSALYVSDEPVLVRPDRIYALRSRVVASATGSGCVRFGKLKPLDVNEVEGTLRFVALANPNCNDRNLVPTEDE